MTKFDFSELLRIHMNYTAGWIGTNSKESRILVESLESMDYSTRLAFVEYIQAYYNTNVLKGGFGYNR